MITLILFFFVLSLGLIYLFRKTAGRFGLIDHPNSRSAHKIPTPRSVGIIFIPLWLLFCLISMIWIPIYHHTDFNIDIFTIAVPTLILLLVGFWDDKYDVRARWRFLCQIVAAFLFVLMMHGITTIDLGTWTLSSLPIASVLAFIGLLWSINLFNFMDGSDGLTGSEAIFIFCIGGYLLWHNYHGIDLAWLCFGLAAVLAGYLYWNWPIAKVFMGDSGSTCLGFLVIAIGLLAQQHYGMPIIIWVMLYGVFIFDTTLTLIRRLIKGEKVYEAGRRHAHHRLKDYGWSSLRLLLCNFGLNLFILFFMVLPSFNHVHRIFFFAILEFILLTIIYCWIEKVSPM
jgi:Fuc2NAc and GlcNAc transferase